MQIRSPHVRESLEYLHGNSKTFEIRILKKSLGKRPDIYSGIFNNVNSAVEELEKFTEKWLGCYFTLSQPLLPVTNKIRLSKSTVSDSDIDFRTQFFIDVDHNRKEKNPTTQEEHDHCISVARDVAEFLKHRGMPEPLIADSGNGAHLVYKCGPDFPATSESVRNLLLFVASKFNSPAIDIDLSVFSPGQICKLYGTLTRKGTASEDRKYRYAKMLSVPEDPGMVTEAHINSFVKPDEIGDVFRWNSGEKKLFGGKKSGPVSVMTDIEKVNLLSSKIDPVEKMESWGLQLYPARDKGEYTVSSLRVCACDRKETDGSSFLYQVKDGGFGFHCKHQSCEFSCSNGDNQWKALREKYEGRPVDLPTKNHKYEVDISGLLEASELSIGKPAVEDTGIAVLDEFDDEEEEDIGILALIGEKPKPIESKPTQLAIVKQPPAIVKQLPAKQSPIKSVKTLKSLVDDDDDDDPFSDMEVDIGKAKSHTTDRVVRAGDGRRLINVEEDSKKIYDSLIDELATSTDIYMSNGSLSVIDDEKDCIIQLDKGALDSRSSVRCEFVKLKSTKTGIIAKPAMVSERIINSLLSITDYNDRKKFRNVKRIVKSPFFTHSGNLVTDNGYNVEAETILTKCPPIADQEMSTAECWQFLEDIICDFPFQSEKERHNFLAAWITPMVRSMIDGPIPMTIVEANKRGTGKTKLVNIIQITYGLKHEGGELPANEEEMEKKLVSILFEGMPIWLFDNITRQVTSDSLDRALTTGFYSGRLLGKSKNLHLEVLTIFFLTVNNVRTSEDISRRMLRIRLRTDLAKPNRRTDLKVRDILAFVKENRSKILYCISKIVGDWVSAGKPVPSAVPPWGSFETYMDVMFSIMMFHGKDQFAANLEEAVEEATMADEWEAFLIAWYDRFGSGGKAKAYLTKIIELAEETKMLGNIVNGEIGKKIHNMRNALIARKDDIIGEFRITIERDATKKTDCYVIERIAGGIFSPKQSVAERDAANRNMAYQDINPKDFVFDVSTEDEADDDDD